MTNAIPPSGMPLPRPELAPGIGPAAGKAPGGDSFRDVLLNGLGEIQQMQHEADQAVQQLMVGERSNAAEVLTAVKKTELAFQLMMQIRNKLLEAFQEIENLRI